MEDGGGAENAFHSPNSPFPLAGAAPDDEQGFIHQHVHGQSLLFIQQFLHPEKPQREEIEREKSEVPVLDGRLAEAAGEEKSANPAMSSELLPERTNTKNQTPSRYFRSKLGFLIKTLHHMLTREAVEGVLPGVVPGLAEGSTISRSARPLLGDSLTDV